MILQTPGRHTPLTLLMLAGLGLVQGRSLDAQFAVSPVIVQLPSGDTAVDAWIRIDNDGQNSMQFRVYAADFDQDRVGTHRFTQPGTSEQSCADRLSFVPDALSVPAGGRAIVQVRLAPGPGDTCWSMLFVEAPTAATSAIRVNQRIGVKVYGLAEDRGSGGEVVDAVARVVGDSVEVAVTFRNGTYWPLRPSGVAEIRDPLGTVVAATPISAFSVLPERDRTLQFRLPLHDAPPGRYLAVLVLDFGADHLAGAQVDFRLTE